jgi:PAS domain S-box-containing protein
MLGWTRDQALGKTLEQLIYTPVQQQEFMAVLADIEKTGKPFGPYDGLATHRDGQTRNILSTTFAIPGFSDGLLFVCMDIDISEMKQKEQEIRANEQKFNLFFNASPVAVAVMEKCGADYAYVDVNQAWEKLSGYSRAQALGSDLSSGGLVVDPGDRHKLLGQIDAAPGVESAEIWATRANGQKFLAEGALGQVTVAGHELLIYSLHDITDKRQMENELREFNSVLESRIQDRTESLTQANQALQEAVNELRLMQDHLVQSEKLASLGALVAGIAHELNTPIGNGLMAVSTLEQRTRSFRTTMANGLRRSDLEGFLSQVETAGDIATRNLARAAELITGFKRVAVDQTSAQRREFDLAELVHEILLTLQPMIKRTAIQIQVNVPSMTLDGYPGPLGQVISNLVQNALLHAFEGRSSGHIFISARATGEQIDLEVADDGNGIPQELVRRVFDPFFTTRLGKGGSGLGLHIVHNLITGMLGGYIELMQAPGGGARFAIHLPRCAPELSAAS